jgi:hypothetical protein
MTSSFLRNLPSPTKIREELEQMVLKDLLGPVGGPEEEIDEPSVRDRYLVGMLRPSGKNSPPRSSTSCPRAAAARSRMAPPRPPHRPVKRCSHRPSG